MYSLIRKYWNELFQFLQISLAPPYKKRNSMIWLKRLLGSGHPQKATKKYTGVKYPAQETILSLQSQACHLAFRSPTLPICECYRICLLSYDEDFVNSSAKSSHSKSATYDWRHNEGIGYQAYDPVVLSLGHTLQLPGECSKILVL